MAIHPKHCTARLVVAIHLRHGVRALGGVHQCPQAVNHASAHDQRHVSVGQHGVEALKEGQRRPAQSDVPGSTGKRAGGRAV